MINEKLILIVALFFMTVMYYISAFNKITNFSSTANGLSKKILFNKLPLFVSYLSIFIVIILEIICCTILIYSVFDKKIKKYAKVSCICLAIYTFLATMLYHYPPKGVEFYMFLKNITIIGGFIALTILL